MYIYMHTCSYIQYRYINVNMHVYTYTYLQYMLIYAMYTYSTCHNRMLHATSLICTAFMVSCIGSEKNDE